MTQLNEQFRRMQVLAGIITEGQLNEGIKLDMLMKDGKPNEDVLVVPNKFYGDEAELTAASLRAKALKKEEGKKDMMVFANVGGTRGDQQFPIEGDEVQDIILFDDAKKKLSENIEQFEDMEEPSLDGVLSKEDLINRLNSVFGSENMSNLNFFQKVIINAVKKSIMSKIEKGEIQTRAELKAALEKGST